MARIAFVTWDGPGQTYLESLFLPILARLREHGHTPAVAQFTWDPSPQSDPRPLAECLGIPYQRFLVARRPVAAATFASMLAGAAWLKLLKRRWNTDVFLPRSILPAGIVSLAGLGSSREVVVFDADGLAADERVDFAGWCSSSVNYRVWREIEAQATRSARSVITRTEPAKMVLLERTGPDLDPRKIFVVPNGKDEQVFSPQSDRARLDTRRRFGIPIDAPWLLYAGSLGPQYQPHDMLRLFDKIRRLDNRARFHVLTGNPEFLRDVPPRPGLWVGRVPPSRVPDLAAAADAGVAFRTPSFSMRGVSPIKLAEYLLCGLPVIANRGVGGVENLLANDDTGLLLADTSDDSLERAARWFVAGTTARRSALRERCREVGLERYSLPVCVSGYAQALAYALDSDIGASAAPVL